LNFYYVPPIDPRFIAKIEIPQKYKDLIINQIKTLKKSEKRRGDEALFLNSKIEQEGDKKPKSITIGRNSHVIDWWQTQPQENIISEIYTLGSAFVYAHLVWEDEKLILYLRYEVMG
jgi:hypothetical protein